MEESARYPLKFICDVEEKCTFTFSQSLYNYMEVTLADGSQLTTQHRCFSMDYPRDNKRIRGYTQTDGCPQDSFLQKHVAYLNDESISYKKHEIPAVKREWELIAMGVCGRAGFFRQNNNRQDDSSFCSAFLISAEDYARNDFMAVPGNKDTCQLNNDAIHRTIKYDCLRNGYKWRCSFVGIGKDRAKHHKVSGHLL